MTKRLPEILLALLAAFIVFVCFCNRAQGQTTKPAPDTRPAVTVKSLGSIRADARDTIYLVPAGSVQRIDRGLTVNWKNVTLRSSVRGQTFTVQRTDSGRTSTFSFSGSANGVSIEDCRVIAHDRANAFTSYGAKNISFRNIELGPCSYGFLIYDSTGITIDGLKQLVETGDYPIYLGVTAVGKLNRNINAKRVSLTKGSKRESNIRIQGTEDATFQDIRSDEIGKAALRVHFGKRITFRNFRSRSGDVYLGPLGDGDGGQLEKDPVKRKEMLGRRLDGFTLDGFDVGDELQFRPGLTNAEIKNGTVHEKYSTRWNYPESGNGPDGKPLLKPGDIKRPAPSGTMHDVKVIDPNITTLPATSLRVWNMTLNGRAQ